MRWLLPFLIALPAFAADPIQIPVEEWIPPAKILVCDTPDQVGSIVTAHRDRGEAAGRARFQELTNEPGDGGRACGGVHAAFFVTQKLWSGMVDGTPAAIVEVLLVTQAGAIPQPLYTVFLNAIIVGKGEADKARL